MSRNLFNDSAPRPATEYICWSCSCHDLAQARRASSDRCACGRAVEEVPYRIRLTEVGRALLAAVEDGDVVQQQRTNGNTTVFNFGQTQRATRVTSLAKALLRAGLAEPAPTSRWTTTRQRRVVRVTTWRITPAGHAALRPDHAALSYEHGPCPRCGGNYGPLAYGEDGCCLTCGWCSDTPLPPAPGADARPTAGAVR